MFDRQGIWAMNQAHHQELLDAAAKRRLLNTMRSRVPVALEVVRRVVQVPTSMLGEVRRRRQWQMERGLVR